MLISECNMNTVISSVLLLSLINFSLVICTSQPIIGILAQEIAGNSYQYEDDLATGFIAASYVTAVESSGARVAPILVRQNYYYYERLLNSTNGVVIPGGVTKLQPGHQYYDAATIIYRIAKQMNDKGKFFPVYSICLGFEAMLQIHNHHKPLQMQCNVHHENYPLQFTSKYTESLQFSNIPHDVYIFLKYLPTTVNNHKWCITLRNYTRTDLPQEWKVTSTSSSKKGLKFIASIEHKKYPFFGTQFHPEKVAFEWAKELRIPHYEAALLANRHFYDVLVKLSKLNNNKFENEKDERDALI